MKKSWEINKRMLRIFPPPMGHDLGVLKVKFKPSRYWRKKHPNENPIITTPLITEQQDYKLPPYFNKKTIIHRRHGKDRRNDKRT